MVRLGSQMILEERKFFHSLIFPLFFDFLLFCVKLVEETEHISLVRFGINPLEKFGFLKIISAPFIHGDWSHLFGNATAIAVLGASLFYFYSKSAYKIFFLIWLLAGLGLWLGGREAYHIGASGIVYGLILFLLLGGIIRKNRYLAAVSFLVVLFYGSFVWGMFPIVPNLPYSWEAHFWGALAGVITYIVFRNAEISGLNQEPKYSFDDEDDKLDEPEDRYWEIPDSEGESK